MRVVRSADDVIMYEVVYVDDLSVFDDAFTDEDLDHVLNIKEEKVAEGVAIGVLYGSDKAVYSAVVKQTFGYDDSNVYGLKNCKVIKEFYADEIKEPQEVKDAKYS